MIDKKKYKGLPAEKKSSLYGQPLPEAVRLLATGEVWGRHAAMGIVRAHLDSLQGGWDWLKDQPRNHTTMIMQKLQQQDIKLLRQALLLDWGKTENRLRVARKLSCVSYYRRTCEQAVRQNPKLSWL